MTGIIRIRWSGRASVVEKIYSIGHTSADFRAFRGWVRDADRDGGQAFGLILTGLRVIYVDGSGRVTRDLVEGGGDDT